MIKDVEIARIDQELRRLIAAGATLEELRALRWRRRQRVRALRAARRRRAR
jgi:hypothetical protein